MVFWNCLITRTSFCRLLALLEWSPLVVTDLHFVTLGRSNRHDDKHHHCGHHRTESGRLEREHTKNPSLRNITIKSEEEE